MVVQIEGQGDEEGESQDVHVITMLRGIMNSHAFLKGVTYAICIAVRSFQLHIKIQ